MIKGDHQTDGDRLLLVEFNEGIDFFHNRLSGRNSAKYGEEA